MRVRLLCEGNDEACPQGSSKACAQGEASEVVEPAIDGMAFVPRPGRPTVVSRFSTAADA
jgi:hypothetical protein